MATSGGAGDLIITVGGDITPLETAIAAVPEVFAGLTTEVNDAFAGLNVAATDIQNLATAAGEAVAPVQQLGEQMALFGEEAAQTATEFDFLPQVGEQLQLLTVYSGDAATSLQNLAGSAKELQPAAEGASGSMVALAANIFVAQAAFGIIKGAVMDLAEAYSNLQKEQLALGAILHDQTAANAAIESTRELANNLGLAENAAETAQQKLAAMGISLSAIPGTLTAIADGAAAMNTSFDTASQRFDQIVNSGTLMARSLTSLGINIQDVAQAMGVAGVPVSVLNTAFKNLDEQQRAAVISAAELAKNAGLAGQAASGAAGAWNQLKNTFQEVKESLGQQVAGFQGLAEVLTLTLKGIQTFGTVFLGVVNELSNVVALFLNQTINGFKSLAAVASDFAQGNFAQLTKDLKAGTDQIDANFKTFLTNAKTDWSNAGDSISKAWASSMNDVATASGAVLTPMQAAQDHATKLAQQFTSVAQGFREGKIDAADYTAALNELNKAQEAANNGLQNAGTALLLVENSYRELHVNAVNAMTDLDATVKAVDAGQASWTQYTAALDAAEKAQEALSGGLATLALSISQVDAATENLAIAMVNAQTRFEAVVEQQKSGYVSATQYTAALDALNKAQEELNGGLQNANTAYLLAINNFSQLQVAAANATTWLKAVWEAYQEGKTGIEALDAATKAYIDTQNKLNGGLYTQDTAALKVAGDYQTLQDNLTNAQKILAAVQAGIDNGTASYGQYEKALKDVQTAQDALNGTTTKAQTGTQSLTAAHNALTSSLRGVATAFQDTNGPMSTFATNLQYINGQWVTLGGQAPQAVNDLSQFATGISIVNGQMVTFNADAKEAAASAGDLATGLSEVNGQLVNLSSSAPAAAAGVSGIGKAASTAASDVMSLGQELDKTMNAAIADLNITLQAGQTFQNRWTSVFPLGAGGGFSLLPGENPPGTTTEIFGGTSTLTPAGNNAVTATGSTAAVVAQASTAVSNAMVSAIQEAQAANQLEMQAQAAIGTAAYQQLKANADAAVAAAGNAIAAAEGQTAATHALTAATTAAASGTAALGASVSSVASTIVQATAGVVAVSNLVAAAVTPLLGPGQGVGGNPNLLISGGTNLPTIGPGQGVGSTSSALNLGYSPVVGGPGISVNVNLTGAVLTGANGMQQLTEQIADNMVNTLARRGIRMTRA